MIIVGRVINTTELIIFILELEYYDALINKSIYYISIFDHFSFVFTI